jgi:CHAD domain-containing protein
MRVATRRLRAALRVFADVVPARDRELLRRELRALGQTLGAVRDLDVQMEQVQAWKSALITVEPQSLDPFLDLLHEKRGAARTELLAFLDSARYRKLVERLRLGLRRGPLRRPMSRVPVRQAAPDLIRRGRKRFVRQEQAMTESAAGSPTPADYHRLRILGKRWRYTLEFLEPVYGPPAKPLIQALTALQDILGLHQDAHVLLEELPALARRESPRLPETTRLALGEVAQLYAARVAEQRALFPAALGKLRGKRWKALQEAMGDAPSPRATRSRAHPPARQPPLRQK